MSNRDEFPPGVPCWVDILQKDPLAAKHFYGELIGWDFDGPGAMPGDDGKYFVARVNGRNVAGIGTQTSDLGSQVPTWLTYISVTSIDKTTERAETAGATVVAPPFDVLPAGRMAVLDDPSGARFGLWEARQRQGAELVNEPGAWNISTLITRDEKAAKAFYSKVFGWETDAADIGIGKLALFRLPGFVGGDPGQAVPRDVVSLMVPVIDFPSVDIASHWSVGFFVRDANDIAAKVTKLGGKLIVAPHMTPGLLNAVVSDPDGAIFSVSQPIAPKE